MANLITVDEFKTYKGINSDTDDLAIGSIIGQVSAFIKTYCNRTFIDHYIVGSEKIEYFDGTNSDLVFLSEFPLVAATEVAYSTDNGQTYTPLVEYTDYVVDMQDDFIKSLYDGYFVQTTNTHNSLKVTYRAGYQTTPPDIKIAAMDLVEYYRGKEYTTRKTLAGAQEDNSSIIVQKGAPLPPHIKRVLDMYRSI